MEGVSVDLERTRKVVRTVEVTAAPKQREEILYSSIVNTVTQGNSLALEIRNYTSTDGTATAKTWMQSAKMRCNVVCPGSFQNETSWIVLNLLKSV